MRTGLIMEIKITYRLYVIDFKQNGAGKTYISESTTDIKNTKLELYLRSLFIKTIETAPKDIGISSTYYSEMNKTFKIIFSNGKSLTCYIEKLGD